MGTMDAVNATDAVGVAEAADERDHLVAQGFSEAQAERLIALKRRQAQRRPDGLSEKRLQFVRWLVARHRLHEGVPLGPAPAAASWSAPGAR